MTRGWWWCGQGSGACGAPLRAEQELAAAAAAAAGVAAACSELLRGNAARAARPTVAKGQCSSGSTVWWWWIGVGLRRCGRRCLWRVQPAVGIAKRARLSSTNLLAILQSRGQRRRRRGEEDWSSSWSCGPACGLTLVTLALTVAATGGLRHIFPTAVVMDRWLRLSGSNSGCWPHYSAFIPSSQTPPSPTDDDAFPFPSFPHG